MKSLKTDNAKLRIDLALARAELRSVTRVKNSWRLVAYAEFALCLISGIAYIYFGG